MSYLIDDAEAIRRRLEEIEAEKKIALTGPSAPVEPEVPAIDTVYGWGMYGQADINGLVSLAHPERPYAGTAHEWRGFVKA